MLNIKENPMPIKTIEILIKNLDSKFIEISNIIIPVIINNKLIIKKYLFENIIFLIKTEVSIILIYTLSKGNEKIKIPITIIKINISVFKSAKKPIVMKINKNINAEPKSGCLSINKTGITVIKSAIKKNLIDFLYLSSF
jgi:hypothetical protein